MAGAELDEDRDNGDLMLGLEGSKRITPLSQQDYESSVGECDGHYLRIWRILCSADITWAVTCPPVLRYRPLSRWWSQELLLLRLVSRAAEEQSGGDDEDAKTSIAISRGMTSRAALCDATEDDLLVSHSSVPLLVDAFIARRLGKREKDWEEMLKKEDEM